MANELMASPCPLALPDRPPDLFVPDPSPSVFLMMKGIGASTDARQRFRLERERERAEGTETLRF